ncbi:MAG TPA: HD domain-containing protein [Gemmatimonadaceae bacterium]|nr:HD domain-containing protein [Gemmatimonadaceae bacterium]
MPPLNLPRLDVGDRVQHAFRVVDRSDRTKKDGEPFAVFTLGNATGQIETKPVWSNQLAAGWADGVSRGSVVQAIGNVSRYESNGSCKRQIELTAPLRPLPADLVQLDDLLPHVPAEQLARLWTRIDTVRAGMTSRTLRAVLDLFLADEEFRLRFERTPGSIARHHARLGGLLLHTVEVMEIARTAAKAARANVDLVTVGALLHDVGKVESYEIGPGGFAYTPCGRLLGHIVLGMLMLERRLAALGEPVCSENQLLEVQHLILAHHGALEFGSPVEPMTLEAELIHWADEASAKANDMSEALDDADSFPEGDEFTGRKHWRVNRHLWRRGHSWD